MPKKTRSLAGLYFVGFAGALIAWVSGTQSAVAQGPRSGPTQAGGTLQRDGSKRTALGAPRVEWVRPVSDSERRREQREIWSDTFDAEKVPDGYLEWSGENSSDFALGGKGRSMKLFYPRGKKGGAGRKLVFGDAPFGRPLLPGQKFDEICVRFYLYYPVNWTGGGPQKLARVTGFTSGSWSQAFIVHVWDAQGGLTLDPASGVPAGDDPDTGKRFARPITTSYNDFPNLRWLGNKPASTFPFYGEEKGRWVCVELQVKLNNPGKSDGYAALWIDGRLGSERKNLDLRGAYTRHAINAVLLEGYWDGGAPADQSRYIDNLIVSADPIGPISAPKNPVVRIRADEGAKAWRLEVAAFSLGDGKVSDTVWKSKKLASPNTTVSLASGSFVRGGRQLGPGVYACRVSQSTDGRTWSTWSGWHQPFRVE